MTITSPMERLRFVDPALDAPPVRVPNEVLEQIVATRHDAAPPRRRALRPVLAAGLAVVVLAAVTLPGARDGSHGLAERAYAATDVNDAVLHTIRSTTTEGDGEAAAAGPVRLERWQHGSDVHIVVNVPEGTVDQVVADGKLTVRLPNGTEQRSGEGGESAAALADMATRVRTDPILDFRAGYAAGDVTETGSVPFGGRDARRFTAPPDRGTFEAGSLVTSKEWFADAEDGRPLGARYTAQRFDRAGRVLDKTVTTTTIERFERLSTDAAALALVTPPR